MAIWRVTQTTTYLWDNGRQEISPLGDYDDSVKVPNDVMLDFFGVQERNDVQFSSPGAGIFVAKIQWTPERPTPRGWQSDPDAPGPYVVEFRAVRQ